MPGDIHTWAGGSIGNGYSLTGSIRGGSDVAYNATSDKLYIADRVDNRIRVVSDPSSQLSNVAGTGVGGFSGDGGPATSASIAAPEGVAADASGNVFIADTGNNRIRKVTPLGIISTVAGTGVAGSMGDGGPATAAQLDTPKGVAVDSLGNLYIADTGNDRIRRVMPGGTISNVAGGGVLVGDGVPATQALLLGPEDVAVHPGGGFVIADTGTARVMRVNAAGNISTLAGCGLDGLCPSDDGGPGRFAFLAAPTDVSVDSAGLVYIADRDDHRIRLVNTSGNISTVAGTGACCSAAGDAGPAKKALLDHPEAVAVHRDRVTFSIADTGNFKIRRVHLGSIGPTVNAFGDSGRATNAWVTNPRGVATDSTGLLYVIDSIGRLRKVKGTTPLAYILTLLGDEPMAGYSDAFFAEPKDVTVDSLDRPIIADQNGDRIFRFNGSLSVELISGAIPAPENVAAGKAGFLTAAEATNPNNSQPVIFVTNTGHSVLAVSKGKAPVTFAGAAGACGATGDGGPAAASRLCSPGGMAADAFGNLFIADTGNNRIRRVTPGPDGILNGADDIISLVVVTPAAPLDVAVGPAGSLLIALENHTVVKWTGVLATVAGTGVAGFSGDGGPGAGATLRGASSVVYDTFTGRIYIADTGNHRVRYLEP